MTSRVTLDTYSLRIRELIAINPATQDPVPPNQILYTSSLGEVLYTSTSQLLSSIIINSTTAELIAQSVQPGLSTLSTNTSRSFSTTTSTIGGTIVASNSYVNNLPISSILTSTVRGLGSAGYISSLDVVVPSFKTNAIILKQDNPSTIITNMFIGNCIDYGSSMWMMGGQMNVSGTVSTGIIKRSFNGFQWESLSTNCFTRVNDIKFVSGYQSNGTPPDYIEFWMATGYTNGTGTEAVQVSVDGGNTWISSAVGGGSSNITEGFVIQTNFLSSLSTTYVYVGGTTGVSPSNNYYTRDIGNASTNSFSADTTLSTFTTIYDIVNDPVVEGFNILVGNSFGLPLGTYAFIDPINGYQISSIFFNKVYSIAKDPANNFMAIGHLQGLDDIYTASNFGGAGWQLGEKILDDGEQNVIRYFNGFWMAGGTGGVKVNPTGALGNWSNIPIGLETVRDIVYAEGIYTLVGKPSTLVYNLSMNSQSVFVSPNLSSFTAADITITSTTLTVSSGTLLANGEIPIQMEPFVSTVEGLGSAGYISSFINRESLVTSTLQVSSFSLLQSTSITLAFSSISSVNAIEYGSTVWLAGGTSVAEIMNVSVTDGAEWSPLPKLMAVSSVNAITYNEYGNRWWAGGYTNSGVSTSTLAYSDNGYDNWTTVLDSNVMFENVNTILTPPFGSYAYFGGRTNFTVNPYNLVYYDGTYFTPRYLKYIVEIYTIKYDPDLQALYVGGIADPVSPITSTIGNFQVSYNGGTNWVELQAPLSLVYDMNVRGSTIVAIGPDIFGGNTLIATVSQDGGYTWDSGINLGAIFKQPRIIYYKNQYIIACDVVYGSSNLSTWSTLNLTTFDSLYGIQSNDTTVIAVGRDAGGSVNAGIRSQDGYNWSTATILNISTQMSLSSGDLYIDGSSAITGKEFTSTLQGLGSAGYVSTLSPTYNADMSSTIDGLGSAGYLSSFNTSTFYNDFTTTLVQITTGGLGNFHITTSNDQGLWLSNLGYSGKENLLTTSSMISTIDGLGQLGYLSTGGFTTWYASLSYSNYVSSTQLQSTVFGYGNKYSLGNQLVSTTQGLGSAGYVSSITIPSEKYFYQISCIAREGETLSTSVFDSTINLSTFRLNLSSFAPNLTGNTTLRFDLTTNLKITYPSGIQEGLQLQNYLTYEDETTQCGPSLNLDIASQTSSFFIQNMSFLLNSADLTTTYPSTLVLHHIMSTGTNDQGVFQILPPIDSYGPIVGTAVTVHFNNI